jgi:hypothetical protein
MLAAIVGGVSGAFASADVSRAAPGALGLGGVAALFDAGGMFMAGKSTLGAGVGIAGAASILLAWNLASHGRQSRARR